MSEARPAERSNFWNDLTQRLENYKKLRSDEAEKKKILDKLMAAKTLTQAKKVMKGQL